VSLSGNLEFVSLDEVLRLLIRSKQQGAVEVRGRSVNGRVFVAGSGIDLATIRDDDGLREHLKKSGVVDGSKLKAVEAGETTLAAISSDEAALTALLREMTVESLYQLKGHGDVFQVYEAQGTPFTAPEPFELESLLADAHRRESEWAEVTKTIPDMSAIVEFARDLGSRDRVEIPRDSWKVLTQVGSGSSVREIAEQLGTTEFWTARVAADLVEDELLAVHYKAPVGQPVVVDEPVAEATDERDLDANQSWWEEPADEPAPAAEVEAAPAATIESAEIAEEPAYGFAPELAPSEEAQEAMTPEPAAEVAGDYEASGGPLAASDEASEVEEDTEAFLEKVFSELETTPDEPEEEGFGLLRRRRMGVLRDTGDES
jgi:hypothetical protein